MKTRQPRRGFTKGKGFTLIELMVVVAIIGIMAVAIVPSLYGYKKAAVEGERSRLETVINKGLVQYYALRGEYPEATANASDKIINITDLSRELDKVAGVAITPSVLDYEDQFEFFKDEVDDHADVISPYRVRVKLIPSSPWG